MRGQGSLSETRRLVIILLPRRRARGRQPPPTASQGDSMDKRTTAAAVVRELRDGMTIGIGGWGSRRKPMALVREILRSPAQGSHARLLRRARRGAAVRRRQGAPRGVRIRVARFDSARAAFPQGARVRAGGGARARRGHAPVGPVRGRAPAPVPADAGRSRLRRDEALPRAEDRDLAVRRSGRAGGDAGPRARRRPRAPGPRRCQGQRAVPRPRSLLRRSLLHGRPPAVSLLRADRRVGGFR